MVKLGVRGGAELRKRVASAKKLKTTRFACPTCGKEAVRRAGHSRWSCKSCNSEFAGGAYALSTAAGDSARRVLVNVKSTQKSGKR